MRVAALEADMAELATLAQTLARDLDTSQVRVTTIEEDLKAARRDAEAARQAQRNVEERTISTSRELQESQQQINALETHLAEAEERRARAQADLEEALAALAG